MRAVADQAAPGDSLRLAVVAALNIADEAFRARGADDGQRGRTWPIAWPALERLIDQALAAAAHPPLTLPGGRSKITPTNSTGSLLCS